MFNRLALIGVGLIGGSLALSIRHICKEIVAWDKDALQLARARTLQVIDIAAGSAAQAAENADMIVIAVPLGAMEDIFREIRLAADAVVTDVGSSKMQVVDMARANLGDQFRRFVPGHPIAGTERSGVDAAVVGLFKDRRVILTPGVETDADACQRVMRMWEAAGATVEQMDVEHHDAVLAETSHLPHLLAFALVDSLARMSDRDEIFKYAAGGFRDFTRIAASNPAMWRDICLANRAPLLSVLHRYQKDLDAIHDAIERGDAAFLERVFTRAKHARDTYVS